MQRNELCTILEVSITATKEECKKAFYKLAHKHHPDKGGDEKVFKRINGAYQELMKLPDRQSDYPFEGDRVHHPFGGGFADMMQQQRWAHEAMDEMIRNMANQYKQKQSQTYSSTSTGNGGFSIHIQF
jgi:DnaJ-class molecular chaperone